MKLKQLIENSLQIKNLYINNNHFTNWIHVNHFRVLRRINLINQILKTKARIPER